MAANKADIPVVKANGNEQLQGEEPVIHINPMGIAGDAEGTLVHVRSETDAPQAAAPSGAAQRAERALGDQSPPAAEPSATEDKPFEEAMTNPSPTQPRTYTEEEVSRLAVAVAERMSIGTAAERELEYLRLREELETERRLRSLSENKLVCIRSLEEACVPVSFAELLVTEDREEMERRVGTFVSTVRAWINREVSMKLETLAPRIGGGDTGITKAQFRAMRVAEQQEIFRNNRPLYEELSR